jgi:hypothetical protein
MTEEPTEMPRASATIEATDVRRLLDSDLSDPVLVLRAGKPHVIASADQDSEEYRGTLFIASRRALLEQTGDPGDSPQELERLAAVLTQMADRLGG